MTATRLEAVVFDFGETLYDETSAWSAVADAAGVPRVTFMSMLGSLIAADRSHRDIFEVFGVPEPQAWLPLDADDLYPDARPCLLAVKALGLRVGIAANQPDRAAEIERMLGVELDFVATSAAWGVEKPSPAFFARIASELGLPPAAIAYVGDRVDNDVAPAAAAGMCAVFVRRGPWGWIQCPEGRPPDATFAVDDLRALPDLIRPTAARP
jgi:HAD superfamily hydrolase (TIGR01549 family)